MKLVIEGVLQQSLPWALVAIGVAIAIWRELRRLPSLAFAVGVYLPVATMVPVTSGACCLDGERRARNAEEQRGAARGGESSSARAWSGVRASSAW